MSDYSHNKGIIYPLPKMTEEERDNLEFSLKAPFSYEGFEGRNNNINHYLFFSLYHTYGQRSDNFGSSRKCTAKEIAQYAPMFSEVLGKEIDTDKLKYIEFCWYNCCECQDYYEDEPEVSETDAISAAIQHCKTQAQRNCGVMYEQYTAVAEWLQELASYKDKTYISEEFLIRNGFEKRQFDYLYCDDVVEISAQCIDDEAGVWRIEIAYLDSGYPQTLDICTVGELRMFLAIDGLNEIAKQLK